MTNDTECHPQQEVSIQQHVFRNVGWGSVSCLLYVNMRIWEEKIMSDRDDTALMLPVHPARLVSTSQLCILPECLPLRLLLSRPQTHSQQAALPLSIHQPKRTDHQYLLPHKHPSSPSTFCSPEPPFHLLLLYSASQSHPLVLTLSFFICHPHSLLPLGALILR